MTSTESLPVRKVMNTAPVVIPASASTGDAARRMMDANSTYVVVVDELDEGIPVGIVTERDFAGLVACGASCAGPVGGIMSAPLASIPERASVGSALDAFKRNGIKHLPVTDGSRLVGMLTLKELLLAESSSVIVETHPVSLYVLHKTSGTLIFEYLFPRQGSKPIQGDLFSGAVSSFGAIFPELLQSNGRLKSIEIEHSAIMVEHGAHTMHVLVQDQESIDARKRLKRFRSRFEEMHATALPRYVTSMPVNVFDGATALVEDLFSSKIHGRGESLPLPGDG